LDHRHTESSQEGRLLRARCRFVVGMGLEEVAVDHEARRRGVELAVGAETYHPHLRHEQRVHLRGAREHDGRGKGPAGSLTHRVQPVDPVGDSCGEVVVVVVPAHDVFPRAVGVGNVALLAQGDTFRQADVLHTRDILKQVTHLILAIIHDHPLHALERIILGHVTVDGQRDPGTAIVGRRTHGHKRQRATGTTHHTCFTALTPGHTSQTRVCIQPRGPCPADARRTRG